VALGGILACLVSSGGCGGRNGDELGALAKFRAADGSFAFEYAAPPWSVIDREDNSIEMEIAAEIFGVALDGSPPTHALFVGKVDLSDGLDDFFAENPELSEFESGSGFGTEWGSSDLEGLETGTGIEDVPQVPDYLVGVDLANPRDVAFAELTYLIEEENAEIDSGVQVVETESGLEGVVFQAVIDPGVFVRSFYFPSHDATVRMAYVSIFNLETQDIKLMVSSLRTSSRGATI